MSPASYQTAPPRGAAAKVAQRRPGRNGRNGAQSPPTSPRRGGGRRGDGRRGGTVAAAGVAATPALRGNRLLDQVGHAVDPLLVEAEVAVGQGLLGGPVGLVGLAQELLDVGGSAAAARRWWRGFLSPAGGWRRLAADHLADGL